jgi:RNA polymerase sigma-70 factor (ECF subfamily)
LVEAARAGDREAVAALLERHQAAVYRFGMRMCRNEADAKDVLQETLLTAAEQIASYRGDASLSSWLYAIARSRCSKRTRTARPTEPLAGIEPVDSAPAPDEAASRQHLRMVLERALASLEPSYREIVLLRDVEGLTAPEASQALGLSVAAVKSRLHRARVMLRERIERLVSTDPTISPAPRCPDAVSLLAHKLEQELTAAECAELETRLARCSDPSGQFDPLRRLLGQCRACDRTKVPEEIQQSVRRALQEALADKG